MERNHVLKRALVVLLGVALLPATAYGQSQIVGQVTDNTGGVLPGVTVEAASPVLTSKAAASPSPTARAGTGSSTCALATTR